MSFPRLDGEKIIAIDTETYGLDWMKQRAEGKPHVFGVAVTVKDGDRFPSWYFDVREEPGVLAWLRVLTETVPKWINHNIKYDIHSLRTMDVDLMRGKCDCTMIRACLIDEHLKEYNLDSLCWKYLKRRKEAEVYGKLAELYGGEATRKKQMQNIHMAPAEVVRPYAVVDSELAYRLWLWQEDEIEKQELQNVCDLESRLFPHIVGLEWAGIRIDEERANSAVQSLTERIEKMQIDLDAMAGFHVNPNPSSSIKELFKPEKNDAGEWVLVDGTIAPATAAGAPSINAEVLRSMKHPAAALILSTRKLIKTRDTFIKGHILSNLQGGYIYPNINQTKSEGENMGGDVEGTGTGRFSYTRPALQQIPARDKHVAEIVRPIFLPDVGHVWSYGDLDQHEFRIFAHYARPKALLDAYRENPDLDIHQQVADMTGLPRSATESGGANAKQLNLAMVFNMGAGMLAKKMGLPCHLEKMSFGNEEKEIWVAGEEAVEVMERYYREVPGVKEMARKARTIAKSRGYVRTMFGRHIRFPGGHYTHKASGLVYQGTSADLNKDNVIRICEYLERHGEGRLLLNIHDEYSVSLPKDSDWRLTLKDLQGLVQDRPNIRVPIRIDFSEGRENWWEATKAPKAT